MGKDLDSGRDSVVSEIEIFPKIKLPGLRIVDQKIRGALSEDAALMNEISAIYDAQRLPYVMIGEKNSDPARAQIADDTLHLAYRDGIDRGKWLVH